MKPGDLVIVDATGLAGEMKHNGKIGVVIETWTSLGYLGGDEYVDALIEGIKMSFFRTRNNVHRFPIIGFILLHIGCHGQLVYIGQGVRQIIVYPLCGEHEKLV